MIIIDNKSLKKLFTFSEIFEFLVRRWLKTKWRRKWNRRQSRQNECAKKIFWGCETLSFIQLLFRLLVVVPPQFLLQFKLQYLRQLLLPIRQPFVIKTFFNIYSGVDISERCVVTFNEAKIFMLTNIAYIKVEKR